MKKKLLYLLSTILVVLLFVTCSKDEETIKYTLTTHISPSNGGTVHPNQGNYDSGRVIKLIPTPNENYIFKSWSGDITGTTNPIEITMSSDITVTVNFELKDTDSDGDGVMDDDDLCSDTPNGETVDSNGCSDSQKCETFLECQDGNVWKENDDSDTVYFRFHNNQNNPWEVYELDFENGVECYDLEQYEGDEYDGVSIIENSKNTLKYRTGEEGDIYYSIDTWTYSDNQLSLKHESFENDVLNDTENFTYSISSIDVDSLTICVETDTDGDGVMDGDDLCSDTPSGETVDSDGCSDSQKCETFLDCLEGTVWLWDNQDYYRFNNDSNNPVDVYEGNYECYELEYPFNSSTIIENSKDKLIFRSGEISTGNYSIITFTYSDGQLSSKDEYFENSVLIETSNYSYSSSTIDVDGLTICN